MTSSRSTPVQLPTLSQVVPVHHARPLVASSCIPTQSTQPHAHNPMQRPHANDYLAICTTCASSRRRPSDHMDSEPSMRAHTIGPSAPCLRHQRRAARAKGTTPRASATIVVTASWPPAQTPRRMAAQLCSRSSDSNRTKSRESSIPVATPS